MKDVLHLARCRDASDVHLEPGERPVLRIDGRLVRVSEPPFTLHDLEYLTTAFLKDEGREQLERSGDVSVGLYEKHSGPVRLHVYRSDRGLTVAMRLLGRAIPSLDSLGLPSAVGSFCDAPHGLVMFTGPTGSGKSTTMAAAVERINATSERRIVTIEDPIEYRYESGRSLITQREIGRDTPNLAAGIFGALRADPDLIVVGETRDAAAIQAALNAAETGHLVFATLHTGDAAQTVDRIAGAFSGLLATQVRTQLAQTLVAVVSQRLIRRPNGRGRRPLVEVLVATDAVRSLIRESKTHHLRNAISTGREAGMQTFEQHRAELESRGEIAARTV